MQCKKNERTNERWHEFVEMNPKIARDRKIRADWLLFFFYFISILCVVRVWVELSSALNGEREKKIPSDGIIYDVRNAIRQFFVEPKTHRTIGTPASPRMMHSVRLFEIVPLLPSPLSPPPLLPCIINAPQYSIQHARVRTIISSDQAGSNRLFFRPFPFHESSTCKMTEWKEAEKMHQLSNHTQNSEKLLPDHYSVGAPAHAQR